MSGNKLLTPRTGHNHSHMCNYNYLHLNHISICSGQCTTRSRSCETTVLLLHRVHVSTFICTGVCVYSLYGIYNSKANYIEFLCSRYTVICLTLQVIPLHVSILPTSALTGTSSSPVTTSTRPLPHMCGAWMEYQWNMMEESLPSTMVMDFSLSWKSVKVDMLREKLCSNAE